MPRKKKVENKENLDTTVIKCGDERSAYLAYLAMFRYAFGRMTYMPGVVIWLIQQNEKALTPRTLNQLDKELNEAEDEYERLYKDKQSSHKPSNYGHSFNRDEWLMFHRWVKDQIEKRGCREYV